MKELWEVDPDEMARVEGGFYFGGDGYCGTGVPYFPFPHHGGPGDPVINVASGLNTQVNVANVVAPFLFKAGGLP